MKTIEKAKVMSMVLRDEGKDAFAAVIDALVAENERAIAEAEKVEPVAWCFIDSAGEYYDVSRTEHSNGMTPLFLAEGTQPADFDTWTKNPYTQVLMKSIEEDYMPKAPAQPAPKQEQCWCDATGIGEPGVSCGDCPKDYAAPVQAQRQDQDESDSLTIAYMSGYADGKKAAQPAKPLTDEELNHIYEEYHDRYGQPINSNQNGWAYERAIEAKIKEQA